MTNVDSPLLDENTYPTDPIEILIKAADRLEANPDSYLPLVDGHSYGAKNAEGKQVNPMAQDATQWDIVGLVASVSYGNTEDSEGVWSLTTSLFGPTAHPYNYSIIAAADHLLDAPVESEDDIDAAMDGFEAHIEGKSATEVAAFLREVAADPKVKETIADLF